MLEQICVMCKKKFLRKLSQVLLGGGNYCSNICRYAGRKNGKTVLCVSCGNEIYRPHKQLNGSKSGKHFCTKKCQLSWISKEHNGHPNWKGGKFSYRDILLKTKGVKNECLLCREGDVRMLAVHHIDKNRLNNNLSNLVWLCHNCHFLVHFYKNEEGLLLKKLHDK